MTDFIHKPPQRLDWAEEHNPREQGIEKRFRNKILDVETAVRLTYNEKDSDQMIKKMMDFLHQELQKAREEEVSNIIADYMEALGTVQLPQEVWLWIADINGKYLNKTLKENI